MGVKHHLPLKEIVGREAYVCWMDVLGARSIMARSPRQAVAAIWELQGCLQSLEGDNLLVYPMNDGAFIVSQDADTLRSSLHKCMTSIADVFISISKERGSTVQNLHRSIVRGAIARGYVVTGHDCTSSEERPPFVDRTLLGAGVSEAYSGEKLASPFGFYLQPSAREAFNNPGLFIPFWRWWVDDESWRARVKLLCREVADYYEWCRAHPAQASYAEPRRQEHLLLAAEYFEGDWPV